MLSVALGILAIAAVPSPDQVLVIQNSNSPASMAIASDYTKRRKVRNVLRVKCQDSALDAAKETIAYKDFAESIEKPLRRYLKDRPHIDFIVLTKGIPIRITDADTGSGGKQPSLDSYLASLDYRERNDVMLVKLGERAWNGRKWANRYWNSQERFSHRKFGGYLVTRLDGYTVEDAKALTTNSLKARPAGLFLLDIREPGAAADAWKAPRTLVTRGADGEVAFSGLGYRDWDADLVAAGRSLQKRKMPTILEETEEFVEAKSPLMGYASWGSNDPRFVKERYLGLKFVPGGIVETAVSSSARTFLPTEGGQSLIADLIRQGATGAKGYCNEPFLQAVASPTVLFDRYTRGWTLAESYYAASRYVGWEDIVIGDPLCAPYR